MPSREPSEWWHGSKVGFGGGPGPAAPNCFTYAHKPFISSECGYHSALADSANHWGTPPDVLTKYLPAMFLYHYEYGIVRSFAYELMDQFDNPSSHEANFGLLDSKGQPKASFVALKNVIALLADPGAPFQPEALDWSLKGDTQDVQVTLLQKRNGDFYLAFWLGKPLWQPLDQVRLTPAPQTVELHFASGIKSIQKVKPNHGVDWQDVSFNGGPVSLSADAEVQLLRIVPQQTGLVPEPPEPGQPEPGQPEPRPPPGSEPGGGLMPGVPGEQTSVEPPVPVAVVSPTAPSNATSPSSDSSTSNAAGCGCAVPPSNSDRLGGVALLAGLALLRARNRRGRPTRV